MRVRGRPITLTDDELLEAARAVFLARGLDATTAEIAKRARISESVIFHRYKTKEALFSAVVERQLVMPPACARLLQLAGCGEIADNLFDAGMGLVELTHRMLPFMMMAFSSTRMNVFAKHARHGHPLRHQLIDLLSRYFAAEIKKGRLRAVPPPVLANTFLGGIMQNVMCEDFERAADPVSAPTFLRGVIDVLLRGSLKGKATRGRR
jgi:AcrR family transcriptional regulator